MAAVSILIERHIAAQPDVVWRALANTDAFNRAAGLGFEFETLTDEKGRVHRFGTVHRFGQTLRWRELPFRFVAPDRFVSERLFDHGPVARVVTEFQLIGERLGTRVVYRVDLEPRSWLLRPLVLADVRLNTKPTLERTLDQVVEAIEEDRPDFDPPPSLDPVADAAVARGLSAVSDLDIRRALAHILRQAPLVVQYRIQPLRIAMQLERPVGEVLAGCLQAVAGGALELRYLLLCPRCFGAKEVLASVDFASRRVHCDTCNIGYDGAVADNIEVAFRPSSSVRNTVPRVDCLQSPSFTPHVVAQERVAPGMTAEFSLDLSAGCVRVEATPRRGAMHIEVVPEGSNQIVADLTERGVFPRRVEVAPGPVKFCIRSRLSGEAILHVADQARPPFVLTVGAFLANPGCARWALEHEGLRCMPQDAVVVVVVDEPSWTVGSEEPQIRIRELKEHGAREIQIINGAALAVMDDLSDALAIVRSCPADGRKFALSAGRLVAVDGPFGHLLIGGVIDSALATVRAVGWGRIAVDGPLAESARLARAIKSSGHDVEFIAGWGIRPGLLRFTDRPIPGHLLPTGELPAVVGSYRLGVEIGRGGMGVVYDARHEETGEHVAVKVLLDSTSRDYRHAAAFYTEARLAWSIQHPRVVKVLDWGADLEAGRLFLAMESLEGGTLLARLKTHGRLGPDEALRLAAEVLDGLAAIHDAGVVHRDLKPRNILLTPRGAVLLDFGVAHRLGQQENEIAGTVSWMSPEQEAGRRSDERSDLYQLGLLLCWACTGSWPYPGKSTKERSEWRIANELEELPPGLPLELELVVVRALQRDPLARYPSARAMKAAIRTA